MESSAAMTESKQSAKRKTGVRFNEKRNKQNTTGLFIPNICKTDSPRRLHVHGNFSL